MSAVRKMTDISCIVVTIVALVLGIVAERAREYRREEASEQESSGFKAKILGLMPMTFIFSDTQFELQDIS